MNRKVTFLIAVVLMISTPFSLRAEPDVASAPTSTADGSSLATGPTSTPAETEAVSKPTETGEAFLSTSSTATVTAPAVATNPTSTGESSLATGPTVTPAESAVMSNPTATLPDRAALPDRTAEGVITPGQTLTVEQCVDIALKKNPNIIAAINQSDVLKNRVGEARSFYYPQINAVGEYTRTDVVSGPTSTLTPPGTSVRTDLYAGSVVLKQTIIDVGSFRNVDVAKYNYQSSQGDLYATVNNTVFAVKQAYYQVLQAKRNRDVNADVIKQFQLHLDQAKGFYDVGTKAKIDVIKAEVDLSNAKLNLITAENTLKIAWVNLNNAMGVPDAPEFSIEDNLSYQPYAITLEAATSRAFENRPDLRSVVAKRLSAEAGIGAARAGYYPTLAGSADYSKAGTGTSSNELTDSWSAGVLLTIPLFSGFQTSHLVAEAKSNFYVQRANEETLRQQILLDVRQSFLNLQAADASISTAQLAAGQAKENLDLANGRYSAGVGSPVEVSDAFATYVTAQANYTSALATYKIDQASIERAMGVR